MRDYGKVAPTFWTGTTGKALRKSPEGALVALYLMSSPHSNMLGLYYQPVLYMAHETGLGIEGASKGLQVCIDVGFCQYDQATEFVWVVEMAAYQVGDALKPADKRCPGIRKDYNSLPDNPFIGLFYDRYVAAFHLDVRRGPELPKSTESSASEQAPSKPHRSQEQEQEQEQDISAEQFSLEGASQNPPIESVIDLPLASGPDHPIGQDQVDDWSEAFPGVGVMSELRRMKVWLDANPRKRKTSRGINAFVVTWLTRCKDNPRRGTGTNGDVDAYGVPL